MVDDTNVVDDVVEDDVIEGEGEGGEDQDKGKDPYAGLTEEQLKERLTKAEGAIVKHKREPKPAVNNQPKGDEIPEWGRKIIQTEEKRQFGHEKGLSPAQVDAVFRYNGGQPPDDETLASTEVQAMIKALGSKDRLAANTPKGGNAPVYKGKTFAQVATDKASSKDDKKAAFEATKKKHSVA